MKQDLIKKLTEKGFTEAEANDILSKAIEEPKKEAVTDLIGKGLTKDEAEIIAKRIIDEAIGKGYIKCSGCGTLIRREDGVCFKCNLKYDDVSNKWIDYVEPGKKETRKGKEIRIAGFKVAEVD